MLQMRPELGHLHGFGESECFAATEMPTYLVGNVYVAAHSVLHSATFHS